MIRDFYWLHDPYQGKNRELDATCRDNVVEIEDTDVDGPYAVFLDERLVDLGRPVTVDFHGVRTVVPVKPRFAVPCRGLIERGDPDLAFTVRVDLPVNGRP